MQLHEWNRYEDIIIILIIISEFNLLLVCTVMYHLIIFFIDWGITGFFSGVTIMLALTIFSTIVGDMLPVSDATPLIG